MIPGPGPMPFPVPDSDAPVYVCTPMVMPSFPEPPVEEPGKTFFTDAPCLKEDLLMPKCSS